MNQQRATPALVAATVVLALVAVGLVAYALGTRTQTTSGTGLAARSTPPGSSPGLATSTVPTTSPASTASTSSTSATTEAPTSYAPPTAPADPYRQPEIAAAKAIPGLSYRVESEHLHSTGVVRYDATPPMGGDHSPYWADCAGTVYPAAIANENAVHMLEHGAVWITYNANKLPASELATLKALVAGSDGLALSPYPNLKTPISLQSWGYQLFVSSASDPRVRQFVDLLRYNRATTPEPGAPCSQPTFKLHPSTFGHPLSTP